MAQAPQDPSDVTDRFIQFYRKYYRNEIGTLAQKYPNEQRSLYVDYDDLSTFDMELAEDYLAKPDQMQEYAEEALRLYDLPADVKLGRAHVRLTGLPETVDIRNIRVHDDHIGRMIAVQGIVRKATDVRPKITEAAFECQRCGTMTYIPQSDSGFQEPHECQGCERQGPFHVDFDQSEFVDAQKVRVQESPEGLRGGETPQNIDVDLEDDVTGQVTAGDHVTVTGVLHIEQQTSNNEKTPIFDLYMDGVAVEIEDEEFEDMNITEEDVAEIVDLSNEDDIHELMIDSVAPSIYGYREEKLAMILQLFSGVTKHLPDGSRIRGDLHMLLIGDPGTGKCVAGDTRVTLADGSEVPICKLVEENLDDPKPVDDGVWDTVDIDVPSMEPDGSLTTQRATKVWKREAPEQLYRIRTASGKEIEVTPSHPLFVQSGCEPTAKKAEELDEGQFVATPRSLPVDGDDSLDVGYRRSKSHNAVPLELPEEWTPSLARLIGYVVAEGYVESRDDHTGSVRVTNNDEEILSDTTQTLDALNLNCSISSPREGKSAETIRCNSGEFVSFLEHLDPSILNQSADQRVPDAIHGATVETKGEFLRAYIDAEGHVSAAERELTVASMSRELLDGVRSLLLSLDISSSIHPRQNGSYRLRVSGDSFYRYVKTVGFVTERKSDSAQAVLDSNANTNVDIIPGVGDTLQHIRNSLALSQDQCGIPRSTYQHYERGDRNPGRGSLTSVVHSFEDRIDRLERVKQRLGNASWEEIQEIRETLNISQADLASGMPVEQTAVSYYERTDAVPDGGQVSLGRATIRDRIEEAISAAPEVDRLRSLVDNDLLWDRVESIEAITPDSEWVYDLEVAGTHSYLSNNFVSHNSAMLQYIRNIAPRSVYTSGKGSSSAGLTAAAVRDDFGDGQQWTLEAGALVLADKGIAAVDELDKMRSEDRSAMHEALEQQSYHPNSEILLSDGRRVEIGPFVDSLMDDRADEVVDGADCEILPVDDIGVHTVDLDDNDVEKVAVDRVSRHEAPDEFVRVSFSNGRFVTVTPEHPMFVEDDGEVGTVDAADLSAGEFVPAPRKLPNSAAPMSLEDESHQGKERDVDLPAELSPDLAEILGLLTAEGHSYSGGRTHEIGFSNQDERLLERAGRLMYDVFGLDSTDTVNAAETTTKRWVSTKLYRWFESNFPEVMRTSREKRIPETVLGASEEEIRRFLVGAFAGDSEALRASDSRTQSGDGGVESEVMSFSTASPGLAEDYADALLKVGVASRIHHDSAEDSWKTYVMGDSTEGFIDAVVDPADDRYEEAQAFVERSNATERHHEVLPPSAAAELRSLKRLLGVPLDGRFRPNVDEGYGVRISTVREVVASLRERVATVRSELDNVTTLAEVRELAGWSGRQLAERLRGVTTSAVHYAENRGYSAGKRDSIRHDAVDAIRDALDAAERRLDDLESRCDLRYYRVTDVETVPNEGEDACEWVYDVTVEPTNTFVSSGVVLHNSISVSKAGINATLKSRCSLLGAANPKYGRFDQYEPIGEQIDLEPALISRFDLIFTVTDSPDPETDAQLAEHIINTNYAGELHTQRTHVPNSEFTDEEVDAATAEVTPEIEAELLRKYIAYAKRNCYPTMTEEAKEVIRQFYVDFRAKGADEDAPVPVTARKLEALVRLSEASARLRLSDTVEREDAVRVTEIVESCLRDIGMDPETGEFDADIVETGTSKTQRDRIKDLKHLIEELEDEYDEGAPVSEVVSRAGEELGLEESKAEQEIENLRRKGEVYEPRTDYLRTT